MGKRKIESEMLYRSVQLDPETINKESRTVELSFSSEEPVKMWYGTEVLDHSDSAVRLGRINSKGPLLDSHDLTRQIGVIEKAWIDPATRKGRALVRIGSSQLAEEIYRDMTDGIRVNVSVGYRVHKLILEEESESGEVYRAMDWEPYEISSVSAPADITVGIGRAAGATEKNEIIVERRNTMGADNQINETEIRAQAQKEERARVSEINAMAQKFGLADEARGFIENGKTVEEFRAIALEKIAARNALPLKQPVPSSELGLSDEEKRSYSFMRVLNALATKDWRGAEFERECSETISKRVGKTPTGAYIPLDVQMASSRAFDGSTAAKGGTLIATDLKSESFIDLLRNKMLVRSLGATVLSGLIGDIDIPKATAGLTAYWIAANGDITAASEATTGKVSLTPKTIGAYTDLGRKLLKQSSLSVEQFVRRLIAEDLALGIDLACFAGTGADNQPTGLLNLSGVGLVPLGDNGAVPTFEKMVELETKIAAGNADIANLAYVTNAKGRGKLKTTKIDAGSGLMVWQGGFNAGEGSVNGYRALATNQMPSALTKGTGTGLSGMIFGNWSDLIIGEWGILDLNVDTAAKALSGGLRVIALQDVDIAVRNVESFAVIKDMITA